MQVKVYLVYSLWTMISDGHSSTVWKVEFSPCGKILASCSADFTVKLWTVRGKCLFVCGRVGRFQSLRVYVLILNTLMGYCISAKILIHHQCQTFFVKPFTFHISQCGLKIHYAARLSCRVKRAFRITGEASSTGQSNLRWDYFCFYSLLTLCRLGQKECTR